MYLFVAPPHYPTSAGREADADRPAHHQEGQNTEDKEEHRTDNERMEEKVIPHEVWEKVVLEIGEEKGEERGENKMCQLVEKLLAAGRIPDVSKVARDGAFRQKMYKEFGIEKVI